MQFNETTNGTQTRTENYEGGEAFEPQDPRLKLYKRTINNLLTDTYYESDEEQFEALREAFEACAGEHPEFVLKLAKYAREEAYIRQVPQLLLVLAANHDETKGYVREYAQGVMQRADEPLEALAMQVKLFGTSIPRPLQRGMEDALHNFDEYQYAKWDSSNREFQYRDLLNLVHPTPRDDERDAIFERIALGELDDHPGVEKLTQHRTWENEMSNSEVEEVSLTVDLPHNYQRTALGSAKTEFGSIEVRMTKTGEVHVNADTDFEAKRLEVTPVTGSYAGVGEHSTDEGTVTLPAPESEVQVEVALMVETDTRSKEEVFRERLEAGDMGLFAKIRNVRNMREAGIPGSDILTDEDLEKVPHTKIFPFRFYQAYKALKPSPGRYGFGTDTEDLSTPYLDEWFEEAIDASTGNLPAEMGDVYVAADTSGSMSQHLSNNSNIQCLELSALFAAVCASKGAKASAFASDHEELSFHSQEPVLAMQDKVQNAGPGGGTYGYQVLEHLNQTGQSWDTVALFTDMQLFGGSLKDEWDKYKREVNPDASLYLVDLASYGDLVTPEGYPDVYNVSGWSDNIIKHLKYASREDAALREVEAVEPDR